MIPIAMFGVGLFIGILMGYLSGKNDGRLEILRKFAEMA
jgi:hypothetical protein